MFVLGSAIALGAETFRGHAYFYGDPHAHTGISHDGYSSDLRDGCNTDGCGAFADVFQTARDNDLDWVVVSDHVNGDEDRSAEAEEYQQLLLSGMEEDGAEDLVVVPGAEVWLRLGEAWLGHKNLMLFGEPAQLAGLTITDAQPNGNTSTQVESCDAIGTWMDTFTAQFGDALLVPHHTVMTVPGATDWSCHTEGYEAAVEVYSAWGSSLGSELPYDLPSMRDPSGFVSNAFDPRGFGLKMAFLGGTDGHRTLPGDLCDPPLQNKVSTGGLTMVVLREGETLDRQAIHDAIVARRTLVTTGPRAPFVPMYRDPHGDVWGLGEDIWLPRGQALRVSVHFAVPPEDVYVVTSQGVFGLWATDPTSWSAPIDLHDASAWLYVAARYSESTLGLCDDGNSVDDEWVWSSPSFVERVGPAEPAVRVTWKHEPPEVGAPRQGETGRPDTGPAPDSGGAETGEPARSAAVVMLPPEGRAADPGPDEPDGRAGACATTPGAPFGAAVLAAFSLRRSRRSARGVQRP